MMENAMALQPAAPANVLPVSGGYAPTVVPTRAFAANDPRWNAPIAGINNVLPTRSFAANDPHWNTPIAGISNVEAAHLRKGATSGAGFAVFFPLLGGFLA